MEQTTSFTAIEIHRANQMDIRKFLIYNNISFLPEESYTILVEDNIIAKGNLWYNRDNHRGGGAVDFVRFFYHIDRNEAIQIIFDYYSNNAENDTMTSSQSSDSGQDLYMFAISYQNI